MEIDMRGSITVRFDNGNIPFATAHEDGDVNGAGIYQIDWQETVADEFGIVANGGAYGMFSRFRTPDRRQDVELAKRIKAAYPMVRIHRGSYPYKQIA